jgi:hypothetical protein
MTPPWACDISNLFFDTMALDWIRRCPSRAAHFITSDQMGRASTCR